MSKSKYCMYGTHNFAKDIFSYLYDMNYVNWINKKQSCDSFTMDLCL